MFSQKKNSCFTAIYEVVSRIPRGKVMTYGRVAKLVGLKNNRIVGFALHSNSQPKRIPCHRVVFADGSLTSGYAFGGMGEQKNKLRQEGITFKNGKVDLSKHLFNFNKLMSKSLSGG